MWVFVVLCVLSSDLMRSKKILLSPRSLALVFLVLNLMASSCLLLCPAGNKVSWEFTLSSLDLSPLDDLFRGRSLDIGAAYVSIGHIVCKECSNGSGILRACRNAANPTFRCEVESTCHFAEPLVWLVSLRSWFFVLCLCSLCYHTMGTIDHLPIDFSCIL